MNGTIESRLRGTPRGHFFREFFTNSAYFPLANIILELLLRDPGEYLWELDPYFILIAATMQAWLISRWHYLGTPRPFIGNLIGPLFYTLAEVSLEGAVFFDSYHHQAYWYFALAIGVVQQLRLSMPSQLAAPLILLENLLRTSIVLVMYAILEFMMDTYASLDVFLDSETHLFVTVTIPLVGLIIGFAHINAERYLALLKATALQLKEYSEWLLGKELLAQAVDDPSVLSLRRHERTILFMDIRGFTAWSESREPEQVVALMNAYYETALPVWRRHHAIKVKFTADEIMLVFVEPADAFAAATALHEVTDALLQEQGLRAGIGIHSGPVVEGMMGADGFKGYDLLGDSVNTAKRLCDSAGGGEILLSQPVMLHLTGDVPQMQKRQVALKGKATPLEVYSISRGGAGA